jgi:integrase/recombinase XerD
MRRPDRRARQSGCDSHLDCRAALRPVEEVLALGMDLMHAAAHDRFRTSRERATLFRDGLMIALLCHRPLRSQNFHDIKIGGQLQRRGSGWWLGIHVSETKGSTPIDCAWPADLGCKLDRYIEVHRPVLLASTRKQPRSTDALWISKHGTAMTTCAIAFQVTSRTEAEFGQAINPHSFRHLTATTIATANPEGATDIQLVLGHTSGRTAEKHYNLAKMVDASRAYQATLALYGDET